MLGLENGQRGFVTQNNANDIVNNLRYTTLIGFFKLCAEDVFAKVLTYDNISGFYTSESIY